jgi:predicted CXXCH cytochrome family protein
VQYMGLSGPYTWVQTRAEQLITHGVEPAANALKCNDCHGGSRMNFTQLGYGLKAPQNTLCQSCHELESNPGFTTVHNKHVREEKKDCASCHNFSRMTR